MKTMALALACAVVVACGSSGKTEGQKQIDQLTSAINDLAKSVETGKATLQTTIAEHNAVVDNKDGDLIGHYKKFNTGLDKTEKERQTIVKNREAVKAAADPFFAQWKSELDKFTSPDLKARATERMEETRKRFEAISKIGDEARAAYEPLMATLKDHALFWANDLNADSAKALAKDSEQVNGDAKKLYGLLDQVIEAAKNYNKAVAMRMKPPEEKPPEEKPAQ